MASRGVNKVIIVGNLGQDPESRFLPSGGAVTNVSIATSETWKDKQSGQQQERTEWHRVVFFNRLGEIAGEYLRKGSKVYVEGSLRTRKWQDQSGQDRYSTEIVASEMQMLDSRGDQMGGAPASGGFAQNQPMGAPAHQPQGGQPVQQQQQGGWNQQPQQQQGYQNPATAPQQPAQNAPQQPAQSFDDFDDDIPF